MDDNEKAKKMLIPGLAIAGMIVLVAVFLLIGGSPEKTESKTGADTSTSTGPSEPDTGEVKKEDIKVGEGAEVKPGSRVTVHYVGKLEDGSTFDSSRDRGQPASFSLNEVVKGWQIGIPGMKPGGVRKLVIPPSLGYGKNRTGKIPPNSTLIFEVELISSP